MNFRSILARRRAGIAFAVITTISASVHAADVVKADNADNLELANSWVSGIAPTVADVALFNTTLAANNAWTLAANQSWGGIRLTNPLVAGPLTFNGTSTLTLGRFGIDMSGATRDLTINTPVQIQGAPGIYDWNVAAGRTLSLAALPVKIGRTTPTNYNYLTAAHMGIVRMSTTGTIKLGAAQTNLLIDNQNNPYALYGNNDWAATDASGNVVAATYNNTDSGAAFANTNLNVNNDQTGANGVDVASIRFDDPTARTFVIANTATSRTATLRGILVTENSGGGSITNIDGGINNGFIRPSRSSSGAAQITTFPIIQNSASDFTIGARISDASSSTPVNLVKYGPGKLIITNDAGHSGGTTIVAGTVEVGGTLGTLGFGARPIYNIGGSLIFNRTSGTLNLSQVIAGTGSIEFKGAGTYVLSGANTYTAPNIINGGLVEATSAAALGTSNTLNFNGGGYRYNAAYVPDLTTYTHTVGANGVTIDTNGQNATFAGNFGAGSAGGLTKLGDGTLTLNGVTNYNGATTVNAGRLNLNGSVGSGVSVATNATLGGAGTIGGTTVIASGATLAPGNNVGTLTTAGLTLDSGALLNYEFASPSNYDKVVVTGTNGLTINGGGFSLFNDGTVDPFATAGTYNLIQFAGSVQGTGTSALSVLNPAPGKAYNFNVVGNNVVLSIINTGNAAQWNVDAGGSWNTAGNWIGGIPNAGGDTASFTFPITAPRTVTLDGNKTVGGATFNAANGYTIAPGSGGTLTLGNGTSNALVFAQNGSHTVAVPVSLASNTIIDTDSDAALALNGSVGGPGALTKSGGGTLSLGSASNAYAGATTVNGGTLAVAGIGSLGSNAALNLNGGGVIKYAPGMTNDLSAAKTVTLGAGGGGIDTNGNDVSFGTGLSGSGGLVKAGAGRLTLNAANTYAGPTLVRGGILSVASNDRLGDASVGAGVTLDGGTLEATSTFSTTDGGIARALTIGANGGTLNVSSGNTLTLSGAIGGTGLLTMDGGGTVLASVAGSHNGGVKIVNNTFVTHAVAGSLGTGQIELVSGAITLGSSRLNNALNVTGTGGVNGGSGGGGADLTTVLGSGTLVLNITTGVFDLEGDMTGFTGTLDVVNAGAGGLRLFGSTLSSGMTLNIGANVTVARRGTTTTHNIGALTGQGTLAAVTATTGTTTYTIGGKNIDATFEGYVGDSLDSTTGAVIAQTAITKVGTGTQTFTGENYYSGLTTVQGGSLVLGPNAQTPILGGNTPLTGFPVAAGGADIQNGKLVWDYAGGSSPSGTIVPLLTTGYTTDGFLTGTIRNTTATALEGLGWIDDTANSRFTVAAALYGDANLSGTVDFDDLLKLAQNYNGTSKVWADGDATYDGAVNFDDLLKLAQNYGGSVSLATNLASEMGASFSQDWAMALSLVPEPTTMGLLAGLGAIALRRRRD